jgi:signal transduction histidine kinase
VGSRAAPSSSITCSRRDATFLDATILRAAHRRQPLGEIRLTARPDIASIFSFATGEMANLMRSWDWTHTVLGEPSGWPESLRSAVSICLGTRFPIAIYWGPRLGLLYNDAWRPILGAKHPRALGRAAREVWPEIWSTIGPLFEKVVETGEGSYNEDELLPMNRHGYVEECYFNFTFSPMRGEDGRVAGVFNAVIETTDRFVGERRLRTLKALGEQIVGGMNANQAAAQAAATLAANRADVPFAAVYLVDRDRQRAELREIVGLGRETCALPASIAVAESESPIAVVARSGESLVIDDLAPFGEISSPVWPEPPREALVLPISRAGERVLHGVLVVGANPRRPLDDGYRTFLELVSSHIASAIASGRAFEEERRRAEQLAELDRAKTLFFSNVSHELRTPLTLMLGPTQDLLVGVHGSLAEAQRREIEVIHRNARRLQKLVNSLLDFSRIEAGRIEASFRRVDLGALTAELASVFRSAIEKAGLRFVVDCASDLRAPIFVDRSMWEKIVFNLLSNALKFTFEGEIAVRLRALDGAVELEVCDTGVGVPPEELPRLFERFHRIEGSRSRSHEGSGIGLALVEELVRLHGGSVRAESEVGRGTRFSVRIPTGSSHLPEGAISSSVVEEPEPLTPHAYLDEAILWASAPKEIVSEAQESEAEIVVADDNADMRDYVTRLLSGRYRVRAYADGGAALAAVRERKPDLVLTDVMMPELDGFGVLRAIREAEDTRTLPVIMLSARAGEESKIQGFESGADDYLVKPFSANELLARVRSQVELARARAAAVAEQALARRSAEEAIRGRDEFLSVASHELRTPITSLLLQAQLLDRQLHAMADGTRARSKVESIRRQAQRLETLIASLLDVSRISSGRLELNPERVDLGRVVHDAIERHADAATRAGSPITVEVESQFGEWDPLRLDQIVTNLLTNAVKYGRGEPIAVSARIYDGRARIVVRDRGIGMSRDELGNLYQRFRRFVPSANYSGLGLGLWIVKQILDAMGGTIEVESEKGVGTTFVVEIPSAVSAG